MSNIFDSSMEFINKKFVQLYERDSHIISVFVVGSMAERPYTERKYNDYDIRCIVDEFVPETYENVVRTVEECVDFFRNSDDIGVASSDLIGPVNHHVTNKEHNILIHHMVHSMADLTGFLPDTHKYMYGNHYLHVCGRDVISELSLADARYSLNDIISGYEGIDYCVDMIKNHTHKYCRYEVIDNKCVFVAHETVADIHVQHENCFYATLKNIGNLRNHDYFSGLDISETLLDFGKRILGESGYNNYNLLEILLTKNEARLVSEYPSFGESTILLLQHLRQYVLARISTDDHC